MSTHKRPLFGAALYLGGVAALLTPACAQNGDRVETLGQAYERLGVDFDQPPSRSMLNVYEGVGRDVSLIAGAFNTPKDSWPQPPYASRPKRLRWNRPTINVYVDEGLLDHEVITGFLEEIESATGIQINMNPARRESDGGIIISGFGYAVSGEFEQLVYVGDHAPQRVELTDPLTAQPVRLCRFSAWSDEYRDLRCLGFEDFAAPYFQNRSDPKAFWKDSIIFRPQSSVSVDGFIAARDDGEIYFAQCWIPAPYTRYVRTALAQECIIRSLGFPQASSDDGNSILNPVARYDRRNYSDQPDSHDRNKRWFELARLRESTSGAALAAIDRDRL